MPVGTGVLQQQRIPQKNRGTLQAHLQRRILVSFRLLRTCVKQKEEPIALYEKQTGRHPILALMAEESARRKEAYLRTGCNSFESERPLSKPMGFWRAQDVLRYTVEKQLEIAEPYGEVVEVG